MQVRIMGWSEYARQSQAKRQALIQWKLHRFRGVGWSGRDPKKWGGTACLGLPIDDMQAPLGCVAFVGGKIGGMAFLLEDDLPNYSVDATREISAEPFTGEAVEGEVARPWLSGMIVEPRLRAQGEGDTSCGERLRLGRKLEKWIVAQAIEMCRRQSWPYPRRRLWLFTEREPMPFLPEMYARWGWVLHRRIVFKGQERWVMYKEF